MAWTEVKPGYRWERSDGAVAKWSQESPYPNPALESARLWIAFEPDPSREYLSRGRRDSVLRWPRRFKTAEAAMRAVDLEYPLK